MPDENPLKRDIVARVERLPSAGAPMPLEDGQPPPRPDREALSQGIGAAKALLIDLARRFEVDLAGNGAADRVRPEPAPDEPPPPEAEQQAAGEPAARPPTRAQATGDRPAKAAGQFPPDRRPRRPAKAPAVAGKASQAAFGKPSVAEHHQVEGLAAIAPRSGPSTMTSSAFWSLMDRWQVADAEALRLIGHPGGLTKKGTRPRSKMVGGEVVAFLGLKEIDTVLIPLDISPSRWL